MKIMVTAMLVCLCCVFHLVSAQLRIGFYSSACPRAESIVRKVVEKRFDDDPSVPAALLRMHYHDCFVRGCDASILIDSIKGNSSEKKAGANRSVRGYDLIDEAKKRVEKACPSTVSCADIITLATRDAVALGGGPNYKVPTGRRDGLVSLSSEVFMPGPSLSVSEALTFFTDKGLSLEDMVTLLGAHTVGVAQCNFFQHRLSGFQGTRKPDPSMDPRLVSSLIKKCGSKSASTKSPTAFLDQNTSFVVDNQYYNQIMKKGYWKLIKNLPWINLALQLWQS